VTIGFGSFENAMNGVKYSANLFLFHFKSSELER
jgi:hypothetical protein